MNIDNMNYIKLIAWVISLLLIGSILGAITKSSIDTWYLTLHHSLLTPPNYVFGIAWSILYAMIAVSGFLIWDAKTSPELKLIKRVYASQLLLNWSWTPLFFSYHFTGIALIVLMMMVALVAILIVKTYNNLMTVSFLLIPYLLWLLFASHLNLYIWQYN